MSGWRREEAKEIGERRERRGPRGSDMWLWWTYSLELTINRHVAEYIDNRVVSSALRKVGRTIPLTFDWEL